MTPLSAMYDLWDAWVVSWAVAALWSARSAARAPAWQELWRDALIGAGGWGLLLASSPEPGRLGLTALWRTPTAAGWGLVAVTAAGFALCWWARLHLGRLWSGLAEAKAAHRVVRSGPYAFVRHPIYTGLILSLAAMAAEKGTPRGLAALALAIAGFWAKARLEERFLRQTLGAAEYDAYAATTPMLAPRVWGL